MELLTKGDTFSIVDLTKEQLKIIVDGLCWMLEVPFRTFYDDSDPPKPSKYCVFEDDWDIKDKEKKTYEMARLLDPTVKYADGKDPESRKKDATVAQ